MANRELFEQWLLSWHDGVASEPDMMLRYLDDDGRYHIVEIENMHRAWLMALATDQRRSVEDMEDAIAATRVTYDDSIAAGDASRAAVDSVMIDMLTWSSGDASCDAVAMMDAAVSYGRELREQTPE